MYMISSIFITSCHMWTYILLGACLEAYPTSHYHTKLFFSLPLLCQQYSTVILNQTAGAILALHGIQISPASANCQLFSFLSLHDRHPISIIIPFFWENPFPRRKTKKRKCKEKPGNSLSNILPPPHPPRRHLPHPLPHHPLPRLPVRFLQRIPHLRLHQPRANQIHPHRPQIQRQAPHHPVQPRAVPAVQRPLGKRLLAHDPRGEGDGRFRSLGQVARPRVFRQQQWGGEADLAGRVDFVQSQVVETADGEFVPRGEDDVVQFLLGGAALRE